jgi:ornithine carbamoyltransferase
MVEEKQVLDKILEKANRSSVFAKENRSFLTHCCLANYTKGVIGNDINNGKSPEQVLADFKAFVEKVHAKLPEIRIAYLGMNPSPSRWSQRDKQQRGNELIKAYVAAGVASGKQLDFIDFWDVLLK